MSFRKTLIAGGVLAATGIAFGHHISVALSHVSGTEILSDLTVYHQPSNFGVPPYQAGFAEHQDIAHLAHGDSFSVSNGIVTETVTFDAADFQDIGNAFEYEVLNAINGQLTIGEALAYNGYFFLRGLHGGAQETLTLVDGVGTPLDDLHIAPGAIAGDDDIRFELSIPDAAANPGLDGNFYMLFVSDSTGSVPFLGTTIPLALSPTMRAFYEYGRKGLLPGFYGYLNDTADAQASIPMDLLQPMLGPNLPDRLYVKYVVLSDDLTSVAFLSNTFIVRIEQ